VDFPTFVEDEWVRYVLSQVHDEFMWLGQPFKITKEVIRVVIGLNDTGSMPMLKAVKNQTVIEATRAQFDKRALTINDITDHAVRFASMVIGYKVNFTN